MLEIFVLYWINKSLLSANLHFFNKSNIRKIRKYISQYDAEIIAHSLVTSRRDNCNTLLCGVPKNLTAIQNCAARLSVGSSRHNHIQPVL